MCLKPTVSSASWEDRLDVENDCTALPKVLDAVKTELDKLLMAYRNNYGLVLTSTWYPS